MRSCERRELNGSNTRIPAQVRATPVRFTLAWGCVMASSVRINAGFRACARGVRWSLLVRASSGDEFLAKSPAGRFAGASDCVLVKSTRRIVF